MVLVVLDDESVVLHGLLDLAQLVVDLAKAIVSWHAHGVQLDAVTEVFLALGKVTEVGVLGGKMNGGAKVGLVEQQALLEVLHCLLGLLQAFVLAADVEVGQGVVSLVCFVGVGEVQGTLEVLHSLFVVAVFLVDPPHQNESFRNLIVGFEHLLQVLSGLWNITVLVQVNFT